MKKKLIRKDLKRGNTCYSLLSSYANPNVLIPVKAKIVDVKWDELNPQYLIQIEKFYDSADFLRRYFFNMNFSHKFGEKGRKISLDRNDFKNVVVLEKRLQGEDKERFYIVVDSLMTCKTMVNMMELFERLQFFMISSKLRDLREFMTRNQYRGVLRVKSKKEFDIRLGRFIGDILENSGIKHTDYVKTLTK